MGVQVPCDIVVGEVLAVVLFLFKAVSSLGFDVGFLFLRVMLSRFVALFPLVLKGRGRCGVWVSGMYVWRCGSLYVCWIWCGCGAVWITGRDSFVTVFPRVGV